MIKFNKITEEMEKYPMCYFPVKDGKIYEVGVSLSKKVSHVIKKASQYQKGEIKVLKRNQYLEDFNDQVTIVRLKVKRRNFRIKIVEVIETEDKQILVKAIPY